MNDLSLGTAPLSQAYQAKRPPLERFDLTTLAIRALCVIGGHLLKDNKDNKDIKDINIEAYTFTLPKFAITGIMMNWPKKRSSTLTWKTSLAGGWDKSWKR